MEGYPESSSATRSRLQLSSDKVCIVIQGLGNETELVEEWVSLSVIINVYIVDVMTAGGNDGVRYSLSPTLQIDCGSYLTVYSYTFCVLGKTLYIVEGADGESLGRDEYKAKSIFSLDLSPYMDSTMPVLTQKKRLRKSDLTEVGNMIYPKKNPTAVATPDGKNLVVFPRFFSEGYGVIELYDPMTGGSEALPYIDTLTKIKDSWVECYGFISKSKLLVQFPYGRNGMYVLDLDEKKWEKKSVCGVERIRIGIGGDDIANTFFTFSALEDRFVFTPGAAYDLDDPSVVSIFPKIPLVSSVGGEEATYHAALLDHNEEKGECKIAQLVMEWMSGIFKRDRGHLILNVFSVDLKYKDKQKKMKATTLKSLKLSMDLKEFRSCDPPHFFSL